jgi:hypothetical protein
MSWYTPKAPKSVADLFEAKKEVTEADAKRLKNLIPYQLSKLKERLIFGKKMLSSGIVIGGVVVAVVFFTLSFFL